MTATRVQQAAAVVAAVLLIVGIAGFVPGITSDVGDMTFAGHESGAMLLGIFQVSVLHNLVHLLFGALGLAAARSATWAAAFLLAGGTVYLLLALYGLVVDYESTANFVPMNQPDNWLHVALGAAMVVLGMALGRQLTRFGAPPR